MAEKLYKVKLEMPGKELKGQGKTMSMALESFGLGWQDIKSKGTVKIKYGSKEHEHFFPLIALRKLFSTKLSRDLWSKRLEYLVSLK